MGADARSSDFDSNSDDIIFVFSAADTKLPYRHEYLDRLACHPNEVDQGRRWSIFASSPLLTVATVCLIRH
jgi:hypothetical protein